MRARALTYLNAFAALGRERHFGRAAEALGVSQSAVSRQISELENLIGFALFQRTTRRVELSPAGDRFWRGVVDSLAALETSLAEAEELARGRSGLARIGYTRLSMMKIGASAIQALRRDFPDMVVELHEMTTNAQVDALHRREIDVGLLHPPLNGQSLKVIPFGSEDIVIAVSHRHPFAAAGAVPLEALRGEPVILYPRKLGPVLYDAVIAACEGAGFAVRIVQHCASWEAAVDLASNGLGVAWIPRLLARERRTQVAIVEIADPLPTLPFALAIRADGDPAIRALAKRICSHERTAT